ncbi:hypothetical protein MYOV003v1_p0083 [Vibrio phage 207E48.1]|nr:hypothetical protein MYOV003v1_p0083 [Vibrio phage 207E48.1]
MKICSRHVAIIDAIHDLETNAKKASMTALVAKSQLPYNDGKKALAEVVEKGWVEYLSGPRAYSLCGEGKELGANSIEVEVILAEGHVKSDARPQQSSPAVKTTTNTIAPVAPKSPPMGMSDKLEAVNGLVETLGFGTARGTRTEVFYEYTGSKGKFQLYPVRGKWTMYLSKVRGVDISLEQLNKLILDKGVIKSSYVALKDAMGVIDVHTLKELLS